MTTHAQTQPTSGIPSISDLDGYTFRDYNFPMTESYVPPDHDDFGFDPPDQKAQWSRSNAYGSPEQQDSVSLGGWPGFERDGETNLDMLPDSALHRLNKLVPQDLPNQATVVSRFGQVTPPRSDSSASTNAPSTSENIQSPRTTIPERRRRSKAAKEAQVQPPVVPGRKRKNSRKASANAEQEETVEDSKRKQSLEKNRLAAAKCRVNKKEKTEQLQRDSHEKAVHNALLKDQVIRMKEQVQQINAILLAHANCEGCKSPQEIQQHLNDLGQDFFANQIPLHGSGFGDFSHLSYPDVSMSHDDYFANHNQDSMLNPPLPEFNRPADFEVHTPMQTD